MLKLVRDMERPGMLVDEAMQNDPLIRAMWNTAKKQFPDMDYQGFLEQTVKQLSLARQRVQ